MLSIVSMHSGTAAWVAQLVSTLRVMCARQANYPQSPRREISLIP
jgi:hypothetical protein